MIENIFQNPTIKAKIEDLNDPIKVGTGMRQEDSVQPEWTK